MTNETLRREEFIRRKKDARSEVDSTAQQLTNIYRQLSVLGEEAGEQFNKQLLQKATPEVLASLKTIPGGEEVRDYYNFLTNAESDESSSSFGKSSEDIINAALPKAEQISPVWETFGISNVQVTSAIEQKTVPVMNPVPTPAITSFVSAPNHLSFEPTQQQNKVDFSSLQKNIENAYEKQKTEIMQALNFIVVDSNIEKMNQNLKVAVNAVSESLGQMKEELAKIIDTAKGNVTVPKISDSVRNEQKSNINQESEKIIGEKFRRNKPGQKFSVDMTDNED